MIVELSNQVCQQLEKVSSLEKQQDEEKNIKATLDKLNTLQTSIHNLKVRYQVVSSRFAILDIESMQQKAAMIAQEVESSRANFETQRRQVTALSKSEKDVQNLMKDIDIRWRSYAQQKTKPHTEMLKLVGSLPEIAQQQDAIQELLTQLNRLTATSPSSHEKLTDFDTTLQKLQRRFESLQGLSTAVLEFLQKTQQGTATFSDLNDEVLAWCQQGDHAKAFTISFRGGKGA